MHYYLCNVAHRRACARAPGHVKEDRTSRLPEREALARSRIIYIVSIIDLQHLAVVQAVSLQPSICGNRESVPPFFSGPRRSPQICSWYVKYIYMKCGEVGGVHLYAWKVLLADCLSCKATGFGISFWLSPGARYRWVPEQGCAKPRFSRRQFKLTKLDRLTRFWQKISCTL